LVDGASNLIFSSKTEEGAKLKLVKTYSLRLITGVTKLYFIGELVDEAINLKGPSKSILQTRLAFVLFTSAKFFSSLLLGQRAHFYIFISYVIPSFNLLN